MAVHNDQRPGAAPAIKARGPYQDLFRRGAAREDGRPDVVGDLTRVWLRCRDWVSWGVGGLAVVGDDRLLSAAARHRQRGSFALHIPRPPRRGCVPTLWRAWKTHLRRQERSCVWRPGRRCVTCWERCPAPNRASFTTTQRCGCAANWWPTCPTTAAAGPRTPQTTRNSWWSGPTSPSVRRCWKRTRRPSSSHL